MKTKILSMLCALSLACGGIGAVPVSAEGATVYVDQSFSQGYGDLYSVGKVNQVISDSEIFTNDPLAVWNYAMKPDGALRLKNGGAGKVETYAQIKLDKLWSGDEDVQMEFKFMINPMNNATFQFRPFTNAAATAYATEMFALQNGNVLVGAAAAGISLTDAGVWNRVIIKTDIASGKYSVYVNDVYAGEADIPASAIYGFRFGNVSYPTYTDAQKKFTSAWVDDFKVQAVAPTYLESSSDSTVNHIAALNFNNDIAGDKLGAVTVTSQDCELLSADSYSISLDSVDKSVVNIKFAPSVSGIYTVDYSGIDADITGSVKVSVGNGAATEYYLNKDFANGAKAIDVIQANNMDAGDNTDDKYVAAPEEVWSEYNANGSLKLVSRGAVTTNAKENYAAFSLSKPYYVGTRGAVELKFKQETATSDQIHIRPYRATNAGEVYGTTLFELNGANVKLLKGTALTNVAKTKTVTNVGEWNMARIEFYEDNTTALFINGAKIAEGNAPNMSYISGFRALGARLKGSNANDRINYIDDFKFYTASDAMLLEGCNLEASGVVSKKIYLDFETVPTAESLSEITVTKDGEIADAAVVSAVKNSIDDTLVEVTLADGLDGVYELDYTGVCDEEGNAAAGTLSFTKAGAADSQVYYNETWADGISDIATILNNSSYTKEEVFSYDTQSAPASFYDDGMLKITNQGSGAEAYYRVNFDTPWRFENGDMQLEFKLKTDSLSLRNVAVQASVDGALKNMVLFDQLNLKLSDASGGMTNIYPISDYKDEWMHVIIKTDGADFTVWINNQKIGTGEIPAYSTAVGIDGIRFLDKIWSASADKYSYWDEIKVQKATSLYLENEAENSGQDKEAFILDFNNPLNPYSVKTVSVSCNGNAVASGLYTVTADPIDRTRLMLALNQYAPAGEYVIDYSGVTDLENTQPGGNISFTRVRADYLSDIRLTDNMNGTATAAIDTVIYNGAASYTLVVAVYDEDEFTGERTLADVVISEAKNYSGQKSLTCTVGAAENQVVQASLWSGLDTMKPYAMKWKTM